MAAAFVCLVFFGLSVAVRAVTTEYYCPDISLGDRSTQDPVATKGSSVTMYQVFTTKGLAHELNISWIRVPGSLSLSRGRYVIQNILLDDHTINSSLIIWDTLPYPDEGLYNVTASSNCTYNNTPQFYLKLFKCDVSVVPQPLETSNETAMAESLLAGYIHLRIPFHGSPSPTWSVTQWIYGKKVICVETDSRYTEVLCNKTAFGTCTFTADIWIPTSQHDLSGLYIVNAISIFSQPPSRNATIELNIVQQPKVKSCSKKHIYSFNGDVKFECQVTQYSKFVAVSLVKNDRKQFNYSTEDVCWHHEPNTSVATCRMDFTIPHRPLSGQPQYQLCVGYNSTVMVPRGTIPQCSYHVNVKIYGKTFIISVTVFMAVFMAVIIVVIIVLFMYRKKIKNCCCRPKRQGESPLIQAPLGIGYDDVEVDCPGTRRPICQTQPNYWSTGFSPQSGQEVPQACYKVAVVYPHNPGHYHQIEKTPDLDQEEYDHKVFEMERKRKRAIFKQKELVSKFVDFLKQSLLVEVVCDLMWNDKLVNNRRLSLQKEIEKSDFVVLVITQSFMELLESEVVPDEEFIFQHHYLHNLINNPMLEDRGKSLHFISVFLDANYDKDLKFVPKTLQSGNVYELRHPFNSAQGEDMHNFCALMTTRL